MTAAYLVVGWLTLQVSDILLDFAGAPEWVGKAIIAVLPFVDLSPEGDQEYFSDGIAEEILNALTRVGGLKVASRTSAFGFKGQEALSMPLIAKKLQVRHVLEGSVRKSGNTIRITAQIIDAAADQHLWSESYDRELTADKIFTIQDEIATAIVAQLAHVIGLENGAPTISVKADTQNLGAYETYLEARALFARRNRLNLPVAIEKLKFTVAADPEFARAWEMLAASYSVAPSWGIVDRDYVALSNRAAQRAIQLNPELSLPYAVLGSNLTEHPPGKFAEAFAIYADLVTAGSRALTWEAVLEYANAGKNDLARWTLARFFSDFSLMHGRSELLYRALTDPDFDFDREAAVFEIRVPSYSWKLRYWEFPVYFHTQTI